MEKLKGCGSWICVEGGLLFAILLAMGCGVQVLNN